MGSDSPGLAHHESMAASGVAVQAHRGGWLGCGRGPPLCLLPDHLSEQTGLPGVEEDAAGYCVATAGSRPAAQIQSTGRAWVWCACVSLVVFYNEIDFVPTLRRCVRQPGLAWVPRRRRHHHQRKEGKEHADRDREALERWPVDNNTLCVTVQ